MTGFTFPAPLRPDVSIVIPTFRHWEWLARTLGAVLANTKPCYELIVVDNASPDGSSSRLAATVENVRIVQNQKNFGFGLACNQGASFARGEFLVFLNSDALVHSGWLPPLLETAANNPLIGAVGSRFLNLDGTIQEAGALLFRDTTTGAYGNRCPDTPGDFHRPRVVDYVSAACLMVKRCAFNHVGGFDPVYAPAYYEDVDLCLNLASHGYLTVYEPRSTVTHVYGWSEQHDVNEAVLTRNRALFARRWSHVLASRPLVRSEGTRDIIASRDAPLSDRLLVVTDRMPEEGSRGAELIRELAGLCPTGHVALLARDATPGRRDDLLPVEIAPGGLDGAAEWLDDRRFHYDTILSLAPRLDSLEGAVRKTQPQASWILDLDSEAIELIAHDETIEGLGSAEAALVESEEAVRILNAKVPSLSTFLLGNGEARHEALTELLVHEGFAIASGLARAYE